MKRADRLSQIVQHLRDGRLVTAQKLGQWLEVSERTIYRDIADLQSTGVPIDGEAGVGYLMRQAVARRVSAVTGRGPANAGPDSASSRA